MRDIMKACRTPRIWENERRSNIMWRGCATPMSRGCLLLLPVVATIRSKISEPRKVGISSQASSCGTGNKDVCWWRKGSVRKYPRCYSKYLKLSQACNSLDDVKCVLFSQNLTFMSQDIKSSSFSTKSVWREINLIRLSKKFRYIMNLMSSYIICVIPQRQFSRV